MISTRMWRALGVGGTVFVAAMLIGITKSIFGIVPSTNLFSTGITYGMVFGIWMAVVAWAIYKNRI